MNRREFLAAGGALAAAAAVGADDKVESACGASAPAGKLIVSPPVLQNGAETSMGVGFAVSDMANGYVLLSEREDMEDARKVKCGGYRVTDMNDKVQQIRLTGLKPATRYYYRIGADNISTGEIQEEFTFNAR